MGSLEVIIHAKVRPGQREGFTAQAAEIVRLTREHDTHTLRCDWFINEDGTECEVHELFPDEQGLIEHKMNTMAATEALFRDFAFDHQAALYGEVSQDFVDLATERMGAPTVFSFLQGLPHTEEPMRHLEVTAHLKIRPGQLEGFKTQAAELVRLTRELDTHTLRYDWFINSDGTECEVHEAYVNEEGMIEHNTHVMGARAILFESYAYDHRMSVYGEISAHLKDLFVKHAGGVATFSFVQGLESTAAV